MKNLYSLSMLIFISLMFSFNHLMAQCPSGVFTLQQQIDAFATDYPNCTQLPGNLQVGTAAAPTNIIDLIGLSQLTSIGGDLVFINVTLFDPSGLENITSIGGSLITNNDGILRSFRDFESLTSIGGDLIVQNNNFLTDLRGLELLNTIGGSFIFTDNLEATFMGLSSLTSIGGDLRVMNNVEPYGFGLPDFRGLENLSTIGGSLQVSQNDDLVSFDGLQNLFSIGGDLSITFNDALTGLGGLENINPFTISNLELHSNPNLTYCDLDNICDYLLGGSPSDIHDNAIYCNSTAEVFEICITLPIEMTAPLNIRLINHTALLEWRTATETNNAGFEIQRSRDGITWEKIAWQEGQGTTSTPHNYTHRDINPLSGTSYYRLRQVDFEGRFAYSDVVSVRYKRPSMSIYPNPVKDKLYIQTDEQSIEQVLIFDAMGRQITTSLTDGAIDVSGFAKGIYTIKITINGEGFYEKIIVN